MHKVIFCHLTKGTQTNILKTKAFSLTPKISSVDDLAENLRKFQCQDWRFQDANGNT